MSCTGILPIIQWLTSIERNPPPSRKLLTIERLQGWSMLAYYPLEHLYYLVSHSIIPAVVPAISISTLLSPASGQRSSKSISLNTSSLALWSCRFWAIYVVLQFAHLREDIRLLKLRERSLGKARVCHPAGVSSHVTCYSKLPCQTTTVQAEKEDLRKRWDALWTEVVANLGNFPLTIHWCVISYLCIIK